jgi:hypothetical protein
VCTEPGLLTLSDLEKARTQGSLRVGSMLLTSYQFGDTQSIDYGVVSFSRARYQDLVQVSQRLAAAPAGACEAASFDGTTGTVVGSLGSLDASFFDNYIFWYSGAPLEAGSNLTISGGGTVAPGDTAGVNRTSAAFTLSASTTTTLAPAGSYAWDINSQSGSPGANWDQISLGAVNVTALNTPGTTAYANLNGSNTVIGDIATLHVKKVLEGDDKRAFDVWLAASKLSPGAGSLAALAAVFRPDPWLERSWFLIVPLVANAFVLCPVVIRRALRSRGVAAAPAALPSLLVAVTIMAASAAYLLVVIAA